MCKSNENTNPHFFYVITVLHIKFNTFELLNQTECRLCKLASNRYSNDRPFTTAL